MDSRSTLDLLVRHSPPQCDNASEKAMHISVEPDLEALFTISVNPDQTVNIQQINNNNSDLTSFFLCYL